MCGVGVCHAEKADLPLRLKRAKVSQARKVREEVGL